MKDPNGTDAYFPHDIQISSHHWRSLGLGPLSSGIKERGIPQIQFFRQLALKLNSSRAAGAPTVHAGELNLYAMLQKALRYLINGVAHIGDTSLLIHAVQEAGIDPSGGALRSTAQRFVELFPPGLVLTKQAPVERWVSESMQSPARTHQLLQEMLLLRLAADNPAIDSFRELVDTGDLVKTTSYENITRAFERALKDGPLMADKGCTLLEALMAAIIASPSSLAGQVAYLREEWQDILPLDILHGVETALDILHEEQRERGGGGGDGAPAPVLEFRQAGADSGGSSAGDGGGGVFHGFDYPAYEQFSSDADWMSHVVLMAKMVYVWLDQLSRSYGYPISRLDQIPDAELDRLASAGFSGLWLIGLWERSSASQRIKQICGNPEAIASAYSLYDYEVAADIGGWEALASLRERAGRRGIRLASDMVPNHTGIYSRWVLQHPDWFVQTDYPPFPTYEFTGENLSTDPDVTIQVEDGYWNKSDAAVVFKHYDRRDGRTRYMYHGNDGTSIPWNDTAQLNYLIPELREAVIQTILHVARNFPIIRFDAAMTLAKKHYQRLWFPLRGLGGGIPSRAEHGMGKEEFDAVFPQEFWREVVDRVAIEAPGTLLLAEAFWMMEGYFVRTLGMHRVYNSAFMNMLKNEENAKYRKTISNVLEFNHEILKRFVNFMNNPDEKTAVAQFGSQGKYFGACVLLSTMPGLPMFGHGQIEGYHEKYGMEYKRAYWDEQVDEGLVRGHEMWIFPLLQRRWLFSGSENFVLYDFKVSGAVDENVFAYSNRVGEQRALILYHNCHSSTTGWIRESVPYLLAGEPEGGTLVRTTLADALLAPDGADGYLAFRDHTEGLEYLRSTVELREQGLYAELKEYQFHVFMDFKGIPDDPDGSWGLLHRHLNGTGIPSLEEGRKQIRYPDLNRMLRTLLETLPLENAISGENLADMAGGFFELAEGERVQGDRPLKPRSGAARKKQLNIFLHSVDEITVRSRLFAELKTTSADARRYQQRLMEQLLGDGGLLLTRAWLLLRETTLDPVSYGLDHTLITQLRCDNERTWGTHTSELFSALLAWWRKGDRVAGEPLLKQIQGLFDLEACRIFLRYHRSEGVEWFHKERFEELSTWISELTLMEEGSATPSPRGAVARLSAAERAVALVISQGADVGYRSRLFLELPLPGRGTPAPQPKKRSRQPKGARSL